MSIKLSALVGLSVLAAGSSAFCSQYLTIRPNQVFQISGNCPGTATLLRNAYSGRLSLTISGEKCSEIESPSRNGRLDGSQNNFYTSLPLTVEDGDQVTIKGQKADSEPTIIAIRGPSYPAPFPPTPVPSPSHVMVPVFGADDLAADAVCTDQASMKFPDLGPGHIVGLGFEVEGLSGGVAIPCDRGGVIVPAVGANLQVAQAACYGQSSRFPGLPFPGKPTGKLLVLTSNDAIVKICSRPLQAQPVQYPYSN